ncbi:MAG: flavin reductase family protein [Alphaproteobacteria bacterium]|nr:flavin reductase family protein [Alphaproteobacteria bacterium]MBU1572092.1 flavin reductase family protein [Alphaproteobacteria bacterium]MBU2079809.1 flavin reductase family protein [Alphaproteobacteria bacterium]MBU2162583.1 flavin reductase family protein [Alphaproteobacteria bacterium]MBU2241733.1 flavin reductase family protein [Alphaproteobacteria bacterium]
MQFDFTTLPARDRYRLLTNFVGPRPIALVTTRNPDGSNNAAPMSFFNVMSSDPALLVLGIASKPDQEKDTAANIRRSGVCAIHMVDLALADTMLIAGLSVPNGVDELSLAGVETTDCDAVDVPRIVGASCVFECRMERILDWPNRVLVVLEVVRMHVRRDCLDSEGRYVNPEVYQPIARLHGDAYITSDRQFELTAPALESVFKP